MPRGSIGRGCGWRARVFVGVAAGAIRIWLLSPEPPRVDPSDFFPPGPCRSNPLPAFLLHGPGWEKTAQADAWAPHDSVILAHC